jgi:hypothetical protein
LLIDVIRRVQASLPLNDIERALLARNVDAAIDAVGLEPVINSLYVVRRQVALVRDEAWQTVLGDFPPTIRNNPVVRLSFQAFAADRPEIMAAIDRQSLARIRGIQRETEQGIRVAIRSGLDSGSPPAVVARSLRSIVGLTERQSIALGAFRDRLTGDDRDPSQVDRMVARKASRMLTVRTIAIARTETFTALQSGKDAQWERLVSDGAIKRDEWEREWVTAQDERTCPICEPLHGQRTTIGGTFVSSVGALSAPPAHVQCRCVARVVIAGFRRGENPSPLRARSQPA